MTIHDNKYDKLFAREYEILKQHQKYLQENSLDPETIAYNYKKLYKSYRQLLKSTTKMTKVGDLSQEKSRLDFERLLRIEKIKVCAGMYWVSIPEANVYIQCGCPEDSVKHLIKKGLIVKLESQGVVFESGPNVILLSDVPIQNGKFANLAEFPVLQMLYRQGLNIPGHPNNTGDRPLLIGAKDQVEAQNGYIFRGNYGLVNKEEIMATGIPSRKAEELMRMKMKFAFGKIQSTDSFLATKIIEDRPVEIRNEVYIERTGLNTFLITWRGKSVSIDLNLGETEEYECPYRLGTHKYHKDFFSVIHTGEGDGWDINQPCMSSILINQGKIYLLDAGPNITATLISLGISIDEIEGIFHTHAHDDHFSGLTTLIRSGHRIKYFSTKLVRAAVMKKLACLMSIEEEDVTDFFEIHDLTFDQWNNVGGMEAKPVLSPHPIETNIFFFRATGSFGHRVYGHFADTISFDALETMITADPKTDGVSAHFARRIKDLYHTSVDLKKVDIAGGMIHGCAEDFKQDDSGKILLSHTERELTDQEKIIGSTAYFGMQSVLIEARNDYFMQYLRGYLENYFPSVPTHSLEVLSNCPVMTIEAGDIFIHDGAPAENVFLLVEGLAEYFAPDRALKNTLSAGSLIGMLAGLTGEDYSGTYRAVSCLKVLRIPAFLYLEFVKKNQLYDELQQSYRKIHFFQRTSLLGEIVSFPVQSKIARQMKVVEVRKGAELQSGNKTLTMIAEGSFQLMQDDREVQILNQGEYFGEDSVLFGNRCIFTATALENGLVYLIAQSELKNIPIVRWKMLETHKKRSQA